MRKRIKTRPARRRNRQRQSVCRLAVETLESRDGLSATNLLVAATGAGAVAPRFGLRGSRFGHAIQRGETTGLEQRGSAPDASRNKPDSFHREDHAADVIGAVHAWSETTGDRSVASDGLLPRMVSPSVADSAAEFGQLAGIEPRPGILRDLASPPVPHLGLFLPAPLFPGNTPRPDLAIGLETFARSVGAGLVDIGVRGPEFVSRRSRRAAMGPASSRRWSSPRGPSRDRTAHALQVSWSGRRWLDRCSVRGLRQF